MLLCSSGTVGVWGLPFSLFWVLGLQAGISELIYIINWYICFRLGEYVGWVLDIFWGEGEEVKKKTLNFVIIEVVWHWKVELASNHTELPSNIPRPTNKLLNNCILFSFTDYSLTNATAWWVFDLFLLTCFNHLPSECLISNYCVPHFVDKV